ncbi:MAG: bifunctional demethylmenaquinone methyltransferase/2-methoxy-6-polyprenyl-1,4-benzoquinol methylase UbiE [Spirochaetes bacterium]|nr:bifunctional demethylmenaquinone methyltransferase/2-methoxy-6-polyprenyl-1,4-benzoquinol methylase UbiE [Spirochaetota bacterium]
MTDYSKYEINNTDPHDKKRYVRSMFDSIVPTYDVLNRVLSLGIDRTWRSSLVAMAGSISGRRVLDICCGTGDLTKELAAAGADVHSLDFSFEMLKKGTAKGWLTGKNISADAGMLPFNDNSFYMLTIAFGIRNIPDVDVFLAEALRVLEPGGTLYILELTRPENAFVRFFYNLYLTKILPFVGGTLSGKRQAYRYLAGSISTFLDRATLVERIKEAGFAQISFKSKTLGTATIYLCSK